MNELKKLKLDNFRLQKSLEFKKQIIDFMLKDNKESSDFYFKNIKEYRELQKIAQKKIGKLAFRTGLFAGTAIGMLLIYFIQLFGK